jgi:UDP:flavonoid glycosyltransferase YjiC (YdhE family)
LHDNPKPDGAAMICLLPHCGYLSETTRMLAMYRGLIARGAKAVIATHGGVHERLLQQAGVDYHIVGPHMSAERSRAMVQVGVGMGPPSQSMWSDAEIEAYTLAEAEFFREHRVRAAVTGITLTALLSTRRAGIPLITEHAGSFVPPVWERKMIEPFLRSPIPVINKLPYALQRFAANVGIHNVKNYCAGFNRVAHKLGVEGVPSFATLLLGDLSLVPEAEEVLGIPRAELEAWRPGPRGYRAGMRLAYCGPLFAELDLPVPEQVERFLDSEKPVVYVAITSTLPDQIRAVVAQLRPLGVRVLVAATVHSLNDLASEDVCVEQVLPSHKIMPRVQLAITAGGQGSVQCALASGTPLIALPLQPEQDWNGQLLEKQGAGARISERDAGTPKLTELARRLLQDPSYRANAQRVRDLYAQLDGPDSAAQEIMKFCGLSADVPEVRALA